MTPNTRYNPSQSVSTHPGVAGSRGLARLHAIAAAVVLLTGLAHVGEAQALALGRIVVQSALGEPLKAEIDVPDINTDEVASLRVGLASGEAFRAAGMDFNAALNSLQITLQRRANGSAYLRLTSTRPVNEPFVDLIVEANWASGRIVRDYTLLLDPPNLRAAAPVAPLSAAISRQPEPEVRAPAVRPSAPVVPPQQPAVLAAPAPAAAPTAGAAPTAAPRSPAPETRPAAAAPAVPPPKTVGDQVVVRAGDTAGRIAAANKPSQVSLDQMLVAILRANPNAFIAGNVNRIKAGSILEMPSAAVAGRISPDEARQVIVAQRIPPPLGRHHPHRSGGRSRPPSHRAHSDRGTRPETCGPDAGQADPVQRGYASTNRHHRKNCPRTASPGSIQPGGRAVQKH